MNSLFPPFVEKVNRKLKGVALRPQLTRYLASISSDNPLHGISARVVGDAYADPTEFFTHYDAYAYWVANKLSMRGGQRILDVGSPKMLNAMLSASHDMTALVLSECSEQFSAITYVNHDVSDPLPFDDHSFDRFTSTVSLPLVGLGRYGDKVDANCLHRFVGELQRVMTRDGELYVSMCLGPNFLAFNNGLYLDIDTIQQVFGVGGWQLVEAVVDRALSKKNLDTVPVDQRFASPDFVGDIAIGHFRVVFCHFIQKKIQDAPETSVGEG